MSSASGWTSLTMPSRCASWAVIGSPVISICMAFPGGSIRGRKTGEPPPADKPTIASGWPKTGVVGGDDEVRADGHLAAAAVGHPVDGGEDRPAQLAQVVEHAVEDLALTQPFLFRHLLALVQVAANREGSVTGSGQDGDAHGRTGRDGLENLDQLCRQFRRDRVVGMRPVEGDDGHAPAGDVLDEHELIRLWHFGRRPVTQSSAFVSGVVVCSCDSPIVLVSVCVSRRAEVVLVARDRDATLATDQMLAERRILRSMPGL